MKKLFDKVGKKKEKDGSLVGKVVLVGQFSVRVEAIVGEGGFATIYRCVDMKTGLPFALKHMRLGADPDAIKEVQHEAKTMARLKGHPNILKLHAVAFAGPPGAETDGFMLLDYCPVTLLEVMQRAAFVLDDFLVHEVFQDVVWAVAHMHKCSPPLAHRDLKAENVLKNSEGRWVICDFGSATSRAQVYDTTAEIAVEEENIRRTTTPAYRAPEMWDLYSRQRIDTAVDVWALGVLLYVLAFGKLPFQGDSKLSILYGKYDMPPGRPPAMRSLIQDMLQVNPADRPDIFQVISKLDVLRNVLSSELGGGGGSGGPPELPAVALPPPAASVGTLAPAPPHPHPQQQQQQPYTSIQPHLPSSGHVAAGTPPLVASNSQRAVGGPRPQPPTVNGQPAGHPAPPPHPQAHQPHPYPYPGQQQPSQQPHQQQQQPQQAVPPHGYHPQHPPHPGGPPGQAQSHPQQQQQQSYPQGPWPGQGPGGPPRPVAPGAGTGPGPVPQMGFVGGPPQQPPPNPPGGLQRVPSRSQGSFTPTWPTPQPQPPQAAAAPHPPAPAVHPVHQVPNLMDEAFQQPAGAAPGAAPDGAAAAAGAAPVPAAAAAAREAQQRAGPNGPAGPVPARSSVVPPRGVHAHSRTGSFSAGGPGAALAGTDSVGFGDDNVDWGEQPAFGAPATAHQPPAPAAAPGRTVAAGPVGAAAEGAAQEAAAQQGPQQSQPAGAAARPPALSAPQPSAAEPLTLESLPAPLAAAAAAAATAAAATSTTSGSPSGRSRAVCPNPGRATSGEDSDAARSPWLSSGTVGPAPAVLPTAASGAGAAGGVAASGSAAEGSLWSGGSDPAATGSGRAGGPAVVVAGSGAVAVSGSGGSGVMSHPGSGSEASSEVEQLRSQLQRLAAHNAQLEGRVRQMEGALASQGALLTRLATELRALQQQQQQQHQGQQNQHAQPHPQVDHHNHNRNQQQDQRHTARSTSFTSQQQQQQQQQQQLPPELLAAGSAASGGTSGGPASHAAAAAAAAQHQLQATGSAGALAAGAVAVSPGGPGALASAGASGSGSWVHTTGQDGSAARFDDGDPWGAKLAEQVPSPGAVYPPLRYEDLN